MRKIFGVLIAALFLLAALSAEESKYTNYSIVRLSSITGNAYLQRASDLGYEEAVVNMPISEGDRLGTTEGRVEVYLGKGNYIRLDNNTKIDFLSLPTKDSALARIKAWSGSIYFRVKTLEEEKKIEIHTPDVSLYVLDEGLFRINVGQNNETEIFIFQGVVEAAGETGSIVLNDGQKLEVSNARFTSRPSRFQAVAEDSFDRWSAQRDSQISNYQAKAFLPKELEDFEYELSEYGEWIYIPPYGYVWAPNAVDAGWRPYYYGRWTWLNLCGWTWIPYEPWGWCTFHYGRWHWARGFGWYWIPSTIWGPAWVGWYWGYDYFGWAPLSYWDYPVVIINNAFYGRYTADYPLHSRALTVVHKNQLRARNVSDVALREESVKSLGKITLLTQSPPLKPMANQISVEKLGGEKLILRKTEGRLETDKINKAPVDRAITGKRGVLDSKGVGKDEIRRPELLPERKIIKRDGFGYPSSPEISIKNYSRKIEVKKSSSGLKRIYEYITGSGSGSRRTSSSSQGSSRRISSSSGSRSAAPSRSSSSRSSGSGKVRKK
jgi:hypothetical protein